MVGVEVGEADDVEIVAVGVVEVAAEFAGEVDALVVGVLGVAHVGKVDQDLSAAGQVDPATISIPKSGKM